MKYKDVIDAPDDAPVIDAPMLALCRWIAEYYLVPLGVALRSALPAALTGANVPVPARKTRRVAAIARELPSLLHRDRIFARAPQQRALYELLEALGGRASVEHLREQLDVLAVGAARASSRAGSSRSVEETVERDPSSRARSARPTRTCPPTRRRTRSTRLAAAPPGHVALLHGVTGSGKTLVYIELLKRVVLEQGKTAIVLVPEIALTPQTVDRFRAVFGDRDRRAAQRALTTASATTRGSRSAAARSASPSARARRSSRRCANLGAIVVDEEHESSYKQGEAPRYHAREVAVVRARHEGAVVVLGSATPSLESWSNAQSGQVRAAHAARARRRRAAAEGRRSSTCAPSGEAPAERRRRCATPHSRWRSSRPRAAALRDGSRAASRASCCSTGAATRRSSSAAPAATSRRAPTAASPSRITARPSGSSATTACTPRRCARPASAAAVRAAPARARHAAGGAHARRAISDARASRAWTSTRRAGSGRTPRSSIASAPARWTSCSARR